MSDLTFLPAAAMAAKIRETQISAVDLAEAHLAKIERLNPKLNAFVHIDPERVRRAARDAESAVARGEALGPLHGVPISVKSSVNVAGMKCESGTRLRAGTVAGEDAPLVARLRKAGAIILGVTNTPELLMAWETDNLLYGRTNSPWDLERTPGGSSGGEAAAIAAGMSAGGVGSDGGGSIRVPAHFSGICGLKPTPGRVPSTGHFPPSGGPFSLLGVVGPMARTVEDLQILFEVMQGLDDGDACAAPVPMRWPSDEQVCIRDRHHVLSAAHKAGIADKPAEDRVGHAGHRGQNGCGSNAHIADLKRVRHLRALRCDGGVCRIFPEFLHLSTSLPSPRRH